MALHRPLPGGLCKTWLELPLNERPERLTLLSRIFGKRPDERDTLRPLWQGIVAVARQKRWYAQLGVEDSVPGRFDMITLICALVLIRLERDPEQAAATARLTELFVEDMDGQLRQSGIGDPTVGKHVRKLVTTLGGRLGALRDALPQGARALVPVLERNVTSLPETDLEPLAGALVELAQEIDVLPMDDLLAGLIADQPR